MEKTLLSIFAMVAVVSLSACQPKDAMEDVGDKAAGVVKGTSEVLEQSADEILAEAAEGKEIIIDGAQDVMVKTDEQVGNEAMIEVFEEVEPVILKDVSGGTASGEGWTVVRDGKTYHRVVAKDMPELDGTDFYEGWLVEKPVKGGFFSTGEMIKDPRTGLWILEYIGETAYPNHKKVVITLEPDDGDPAPAAHIIEN